MSFHDAQLEHAHVFRRSYYPSKVPEVVKLWREEVGATNKKSGQSLADPEQYENLFPEYAVSFRKYIVLTCRVKCLKMSSVNHVFLVDYWGKWIRWYKVLDRLVASTIDLW